MADQKMFLRYASPNERRTISREELGHYHAVIIAGIYRFTGDADTLNSGAEPFFAPLKECIAQHPFLSVIVGDKHTEKSFYQRVENVDLSQHIHIITRADGITDKSWTPEVEDLLRRDLDRPFKEGIPPWRVVILPLPLDSDPKPGSGSDSDRRYLIAFEFSHAIGDGPSGVAFHHSFYSALKRNIKATPSLPSGNLTSITAGNTQTFPPPFDTPQRLRISWGYLLGPLLAALLPSFITNLLGLKAQASTTNEGTWTGTPCFFDPGKGTQSKVVVISIPKEDIERALKEARGHGAKLTGVIHLLVVRALTKALTSRHNGGAGKGEKEIKITNFVSTTPINMRRAVGVSPLEMGEFASGVYITFPVTPSDLVSKPDNDGVVKGGTLTEEEWASAREATLKLADATSRLDDQPIGLLRYVPSIRNWLIGKLGKTRDASYEVSNLGVVHFGDSKDMDTDTDSKQDDVEIEHVVFAQPGQVTSHAINFNVASTKTGGMVVTITWPTGGLGLQNGADSEEVEEEEEKFVREVGEELTSGFKLF